MAACVAAATTSALLAEVVASLAAVQAVVTAATGGARLLSSDGSSGSGVKSPANGIVDALGLTGNGRTATTTAGGQCNGRR